MPFAGLAGSDLPAASGFQCVANPYGEGQVVAIPAIRPDVALLHVQEADEEGDLHIWGAHYEDALLAKAARRVIATAERIVPRESFSRQPELTALPGFLVDMVVEAPHGAWPTSSYGCYSYDDQFLTAYASAAKTQPGFDHFMATALAHSASHIPT